MGGDMNAPFVIQDKFPLPRLYLFYFLDSSQAFLGGRKEGSETDYERDAGSI
jgi:hypothetical protein